MTGTLFVVATPIGNLEDITLRALRVLREVQFVAAEDTRRTRKLLGHYNIHVPVFSLREHNERREGPRLVQKLLAGTSVALVSDAGTPGVSDPGALFVRLAREADIPIVAVPGASAVTAALSISGLPMTEFAFMGFPPPSGAARRRWFERLEREERVVVFFEAPHRIRRTLTDDWEYFGNRQISLFREISKVNESFVIWPITPDCSLGDIPERGEFTVVVGQSQHQTRMDVDQHQALDIIGRLTEVGGIDTDSAIVAASSITGASEGSLRKALKRASFSVKQQSDRSS